MKIHIDLDKLLGWELSLTVGRKDYEAEAPSLGDLATILSFNQKSDPESLRKMESAIADFGYSLLVADTRPTLSTPQWQGVMLVVMDYWQRTVSKNGSSIALLLGEAMEKQASK